MLSKLRNIVEGWGNYVFENDEVESIARQRAEECGKCDEAIVGIVAALVIDEIKDIEGMVCNKCNCPLSAKTRSLNETCPLRKWKV